MEKVLFIANEVRHEIENWVHEKHNQISKFEINKQNLAGACGISSWLLNKLLKKNKIHSELVAGYYVHTVPVGHCWVELIQSAHIVDITATQFGINDKVYIKKVDGDKMYKVSRHGKAAEHVLKSWGNQNPFSYEQDLRDIYKRISKKCQN